MTITAKILLMMEFLTDPKMLTVLILPIFMLVYCLKEETKLQK